MSYIETYKNKYNGNFEDRRVFDFVLFGKKQKVTASGILLTTIKNNKKYFLLTQEFNGLTDVGGKAIITDDTALITAWREFHEETNASLFCRIKDIDVIKKHIPILINVTSQLYSVKKRIYVIKSKYLIHIVNIPSFIMDLHDNNWFGDTELYENVSRNIKWWSSEEIQKYLDNGGKLQCRLRNKLVYETLQINL